MPLKPHPTDPDMLVQESGSEMFKDWVGLTDDEIAEIESEYIVDYRTPAGSALNFAKAYEAKLKQKNGYAEENT